VPAATLASLAAVVLAPLLLLAPALRPGYVLSAADRALEWHLFSAARPPGWTGAANPLIADTVMQFLPWRRFAVDELRAGRIPFWNPHAFAGSPLLGNSQSAVFDPLAVPYLLVDEPSRATVWVALLRMWVAGLGTWLFVRRLGASPAAAALAGVVYACGGVTTVWLLFPLVSSSCWFPFALLAAESLARCGSPRAVAGLALALTASLLGGQVEVAFLSAVAAAAFVLVRRGQLGGWSPRTLAAGVAAVAGAALLTVALSAVHAGPFLDTLTQGSLAGSRADLAAAMPAFPPSRFDHLVLQVFPYLFGRPVAGEPNLAGPYTNYCEQSGAYASLLGLALAIVGLAAAPRRSATRVLAALGVAAWLAAGYFPPFPALARLLPPFNVMPLQRGAFIALLALAVLAASGLDALADRTGRRPVAVGRTAAIAIGVLAVVAVAAATWLLRGAPGHDGVLRFFGQSRVVASWFAGKHDFMLTKFGTIAPSLARLYVLPWLVTAVGAIAVLLAGRRRGWAGATAIVVVAADLFWFGHGHNPAIRAELAYPETARLTELRQAAGDGRVLVLDWGMPPNLGTYVGLDDVLGYDAIGRRRLELLMSFAGPFRPGPLHFRLGHFDRYESPVLDVLGVRAVAASKAREVRTLRPPATSKGFLYENPRALPRAFVPREVVVAADLDGARDLVRTEPRLADPAACVVVEASDGSGLAGVRGTVRWRRPAPARFELDVAMETPGVVVVSEGWDPGWRATIDGAPAPVYPCELALIAVPVPIGAHLVTLAYRPRGWNLAVGLTALGVLVGLGMLAVPPRGARTKV